MPWAQGQRWCDGENAGLQVVAPGEDVPRGPSISHLISQPFHFSLKNGDAHYTKQTWRVKKCHRRPESPHGEKLLVFPLARFHLY